MKFNARSTTPIIGATLPATWALEMLQCWLEEGRGEKVRVGRGTAGVDRSSVDATMLLRSITQIVVHRVTDTYPGRTPRTLNLWPLTNSLRRLVAVEKVQMLRAPRSLLSSLLHPSATHLAAVTPWWREPNISQSVCRSDFFWTRAPCSNVANLCYFVCLPSAVLL